MSQDITTTSAVTTSAISPATFTNKLVALLSKHRAQDASFYVETVRLYEALKDRDTTLPAALKACWMDGRQVAKSTFLAWVQCGTFLLTHGGHAPFDMLSQRSLRFLCTEEWTPEVIATLYGLNEEQLNDRIRAAQKANKTDTAPRVPTGETVDRGENDTPSITVQAGLHSAQTVTLSRETLALFQAVADTVPADGEPLTADDIAKYLATRYLAARKPRTATAAAH